MGYLKDLGIETAASTRSFIRFGDVPKSGRSKLWTAPNAFHNHKVGTELPGMSVYEVKKQGKKYRLVTDDINSGSGYASLAELFYRHSQDRKLPIYLITGTPVRWKDLTESEKDQFDDYYPGGDKYDILGTDGEPLLREYKLVDKIDVDDLICKMVGFPEDYDIERV